MKTSEITQKLADIGIKCDRRTLARDIKLLKSEGFEIFSEKIGHNMCFWVDDSAFSSPELNILLTNIQADRFLPEDKEKELADKIAALSGAYNSRIKERRLIRFNSNKCQNKCVYYNLDYIYDAIFEGKKVSFEYRVPDENAEPVLHNPSVPKHIVEPVVPMIKDDNYYLICYDAEKDNKTCTYRVDRMYAVSKEGEMSAEALFFAAGFDAAAYNKQVRRMYGGEAMTVTLEFSRKLIPVVYDEFGFDTKITANGDVCQASVDVQISPTFWGWLFTFAGNMKIISPDRALELQKQYIERIIKATL
ncbi:MAG: WYL domain-containing protein [Clostridiales bacterium]|nr:WYL domain-containing protein [Clostridiales bacterium]